MNKQASILFIPPSFVGGRVDIHDAFVTNRHYQHLVQTALAAASDTREGLRLGCQLASIADHALAAKRTDAAEQIAQLLLGLRISGQLHGTARYYQAECLKRRGDFDNARRICELVVETSTPIYRARALQCIGATYYESGEIFEAVPFYVAAGKAAAGCDPSRIVQSQKMLAAVRSINGDHRATAWRALSSLVGEARLYHR